MLWSILSKVPCIFHHRYIHMKLFDVNLQMFAYGNRCARCGKTVMD